MQVILDANNPVYYMLRGKELLTEASTMVIGPVMNEKLRLAQILINIVRAECEQKSSKPTDQQDQKRSSKGQ